MKLSLMTVRNFKNINEDGVEIRIDNIVLLIGPNNCGKSTILDAYEAFASSGKALPISSFHNEEGSNEIEIEATFNEVTAEDLEKLGNDWKFDHDELGGCIRLKWVWPGPDQKAKKFSWNPSDTAWQEGGMGGWDSLIASRVPFPLRIKPTDPPDEREKQIVAILSEAVKESVKSDSTQVAGILEEISKLADSVSETVQDKIDETCELVMGRLSDVFDGHTVKLEKAIGKLEPEKIIGSGSHLRIAKGDHAPLPLSVQGTGLQRAFLWSALSALADSGHVKRGTKRLGADTMKILLIDEPESFLHPPAVRDARESLYKIAELASWQVIASTHSPVFVDVSKPHTTIVRVNSTQDEQVRTFQTESAQFSQDEREALKMIRLCHPTVNEFFFAEHVILVEGDTEMAVFQKLAEDSVHEAAKRIHVVNCLGKGNIPTFGKILNQFGTGYVAVHDSDSPRCRRGDGTARNGAWSVNASIRETVDRRSAELPESFTLVHVPDFEEYYFQESVNSDKPFNALRKLASGDFSNELDTLLDQILDGNHPCFYSSSQELSDRVVSYVEESVTDAERGLWVIDQ
ncbi:MAG: endonuclease [Planctomycetota bacterium]|nr:MAG: endonuclease [Planctomycetota bacterium]